MSDAPKTTLYEELVSDPRYLEAIKAVPIFGVCGPNGSGKDYLLEVLQKEGFLAYNTGDSLRQISMAVMGTTQRGGNDSPVGKIANYQRTRYPGGMVELGMLDWWVRISHLPAELQPRGLVIGSIRAIGEVQRLQALGGKLIVVDADARIRYDRIKNRGRHYEQELTFEQFIEEEAGEMGHNETDPTKFTMAAVIKMADITIMNEGTYDEFVANVNAALKAEGINIKS
jgi:dephospho-CoA kinase